MAENSRSSTFKPFEYVAGDRTHGLLLVCDHARRDIPAIYESLGLPEVQLERHIAYDIGVRAVTWGLARALNVPAVLSTFSRLLIDPNRGADDPTLVMRLSDGALIPGNARIDSEEIEKRRQTYYEPYHRRVNAELQAIEGLREGRAATIFSIHSFTPIWRGIRRPWQAAVLWDSDPRFAKPLIDALCRDTSLTVGDNEPYDGALLNDCMFRHGTSKGRAHALLELRQDLISHQRGIDEWVARLAPILENGIKNPSLDEHLYYPSRTSVGNAARRVE